MCFTYLAPWIPNRPTMKEISNAWASQYHDKLLKRSYPSFKAGGEWAESLHGEVGLKRSAMLSVNDCKSQVPTKRIGERNGPEWEMSQRFLITVQQSELETEAPLYLAWHSMGLGGQRNSIHISLGQLVILTKWYESSDVPKLVLANINPASSRED